MANPPLQTPERQPWEINGPITRLIEWLEFGARCVLMPFTGSASEYIASGLRQDYQRLRSGRATYWYDRKHEQGRG